MTAGACREGATLVNLETVGETFTWDYTAEGDPNASCFYDQNMDFVCNNTSTSAPLTGIGIQATVTVSTTAGGSFTSPTEAEFAISKSITCSGSQCSVAASVFGVSGFPCLATFTTSAENTDSRAPRRTEALPWRPWSAESSARWRLPQPAPDA
ncbi:MAG: hypothetical protein KDA24_18225 [Deltaproteobacteria bacterium]|nr:hypothetical protein [Deltaproteobacteria bacterium]